MDARNGKPRATLAGHTAFVRHLTFSPNGERLASASNDQTARLWNVPAGKLVATLEGHTGAVNHVTFSPNGQLLATGDGDGTVRLWDVKNLPTSLIMRGNLPSPGTAAAREAPGHAARAHGGRYHLAFSSDSKYLASASKDTTVRLWDVQERRPLATLRGHTGAVNQVAFSPDGKRLASASADGTVRLWFSEDTPERRAYRSQFWREKQAEEAEAAGEWFAAAFHLAELPRSQTTRRSTRAGKRHSPSWRRWTRNWPSAPRPRERRRQRLRLPLKNQKALRQTNLWASVGFGVRR